MKNERFGLFVALGIVFWLNGALIVRFLGDRVFREGSHWLMVMFAAAVPITALAIMVTKWISGLAYSSLLRPLVIMTFTAVFLDGTVLTWGRSFYAEDYEVALHGAAWILWGGGLGLLFGYLLERRVRVPMT